MKYYDLGEVKGVSAIGVGCMRIGGKSEKEAAEFVDAALCAGLNFFDHANIYGGGGCEEVFGRLLRATPSLRDKMILQTKCGITEGRYCFEKEHIIESVEASLRRLGTDYVDVLLLHRPDILMEPEEVAEAFDLLQSKGMVRAFGMSNQNSFQLELLSRSLHQPIVANQMQLGPAFTPMLDAGANVNNQNGRAEDKDGMVRDYCRLKGIRLQAWSPFQHGFFRGVFFGEPSYAPLTAALTEVGEKYGISPSAAVMAWLLRLPEGVQPIVGTANPQRLTDLARGADVRITHEEWYRIYKAAGNQLP